MGTIDIGQQKISFDYNSAAHSELINEILHKTIPLGIKQGMVLSKYSASEIQITPGVTVAEDVTNKVSVRVETQINIVVSVIPSQPYIICRYRWTNDNGNYADFESVGYADIEDGDVILGRAIFKEGVLQENIDTTLRGKTKSQLPDILVVAEKPQSDKVVIHAGKFWIDKNYVSIDSPTVSPAFSETTTSARVDLLCIDRYGVLSVVEGYTDEFPSQVLPIAKISRDVNRATIEDDEIEVLTSYVSYFGGVHGQFVTGKFANADDTQAFIVGNGASAGSPDNAFAVKYDGTASVKSDLTVGGDLYVTGGDIDTTNATLSIKRNGNTVIKIDGTKTIIGENNTDTTGMRNNGLRISANEGATNPLFDIRNNGADVLSFKKDYIEGPKINMVSNQFRVGNQDSNDLYIADKVAGQLTVTHIDGSDTNPERGSLFCIQEKLPSSYKRLIDFTSINNNEKRWTLELNDIVLKPNNSVFNMAGTRLTSYIGDPVILEVNKVYVPLVPGEFVFYKWIKTNSGGIWRFIVAPSYSDAVNSYMSFQIAQVIAWERQNWFSYPQKEGRYVRMVAEGITTGNYYFRFIPFGAPVNGQFIREVDASVPSEGLSYTDILGDGTKYSVSKGVANVTELITVPRYYAEGQVTAITDNGFKDCTSLPRYVLPVSVTKIGESAFENCTSLTGDTSWETFLAYQTIPSYVTEIGAKAYKGCTSLQRAIFAYEGPSLTLGNEAFMNCTSLTNIPLPPIGGGTSIPMWIGNNIVSIGDSCFENCTGLGPTVIIPAATNNIGISAFAGCTGITAVSIGANVATIGAEAFANDTALQSVYMEGMIPPVTDDSIFSGCTSLTIISVPAGSLTAYQAATGWSTYSAILFERS